MPSFTRSSLLFLLVWLGLPAADLAVPGSDLVVTLQPGWIPTTPSSGAALILVHTDPSGPDHGGRLAISVETIPRDTTTSVYATQAQDRLAGMATGLVSTLSDIIAIHGQDWHRLRFRFQTGQVAWEQDLLVTVRGRHGYCVACGSAQEDFVRWEGAFSALVASLRFGH